MEVSLSGNFQISEMRTELPDFFEYLYGYHLITDLGHGCIIPFLVTGFPSEVQGKLEKKSQVHLNSHDCIKRALLQQKRQSQLTEVQSKLEKSQVHLNSHDCIKRALL